MKHKTKRRSSGSRSNRKSIFPTYLQGKETAAYPMFRCEVCPGETMKSFTARMRFASATMNKMVLSPLVLDVKLFYVPHRLVWSDFVEWIMGTSDASGSLAVPTAAGIVQSLGWHAFAGTRSALPLRAWKSIYNRYYLDEDLDTPYVVSDDTILSASGETLRQEGAEAHFKPVTEIVSNEIDISVNTTTGAGTIDLDALRLAMKQAQRRGSQELSGDRYVDYLRASGVRADWRIQTAPEYLGSSRTYIKPRVQRASDTTSLAKGKSFYDAEIKIDILERKRFAEHGTVMAIVVVRPRMHSIKKRAQLQDFMLAREDYYQPLLAGKSTFDTVSSNEWFGIAGGDVALKPWPQYFEGEHFSNTGLGDPDVVDFARTFAPFNLDELRRPPFSKVTSNYSSGDLVDENAVGETWAMEGTVSYRATTPIKRSARA